MEQQAEQKRPYHVAVPKYWFRQKPIFSDRLSEYEKKLRTQAMVGMELNAGNLIYSKINLRITLHKNNSNTIKTLCI